MLREFADKGGRGSKNPKILRTSYVYRPLGGRGKFYVVVAEIKLETIAVVIEENGPSVQYRRDSPFSSITNAYINNLPLPSLFQIGQKTSVNTHAPLGFPFHFCS